jgi:hypothetical protein
VFQALAGTTYHLVVGGYDGVSTGGYNVSVNPVTFPVNPGNLPGGFADASKSPLGSPPRPAALNSGALLFTLPARPPAAVLTLVDAGVKPGRRGHALRLAFNEGLNRRSAGGARVRVFAAGRDGVFGTRDDRVSQARTIRYNVARRELTLTLPKGEPAGGYRVTLAGLRGTSGRRLDGDFDGRPGGTLVMRVTSRGVVVQGVKPIVEGL